MPSKKKPKKPDKMGRPPIEIDWKTLEEACDIQCTQEEIARLLRCSVDTLDRKCKAEKDMSFAEYHKIYSEGGRKSLRRRLFDIAMSDTNRGATTACIWLSKQHLGMKDRHEDDRFKDLVPLVIETTNGKKTFSMGKLEEKDE